MPTTKHQLNIAKYTSPIDPMGWFLLLPLFHCRFLQAHVKILVENKGKNTCIHLNFFDFCSCVFSFFACMTKTAPWLQRGPLQVLSRGI